MAGYERPFPEEEEGLLPPFPELLLLFEELLDLLEEELEELLELLEEELEELLELLREKERILLDEDELLLLSLLLGML